MMHTTNTKTSKNVKTLITSKSLPMWVFFFFQAEDGIRDFHVTGVQTCALPIYAGGHLDRHGRDRDGLQVTAEFAMAADRPARVRGVTLRIRVPGGIPPASHAALLAVVSHCTVHNTLRQAPDIAIELT